MTIAIGFCSADTVNAYFVRALHRFIAQYPTAIQGLIHVISGPWMFENRNLVTETFLSGPADRLVMLDDDILFDPSHITDLLDHDLACVSGLYVAEDGRRMAAYRDEEGAYAWARKTKFEPLSRVDAVGMGICTVRREVFEKIGSGWFDPLRDLGEDVAFCERVVNAGFDIWLDSTVQVGHMKYRALTP